jgi:hypothetical protein
MFLHMSSLLLSLSVTLSMFLHIFLCFHNYFEFIITLSHVSTHVFFVIEFNCYFEYVSTHISLFSQLFRVHHYIEPCFYTCLLCIESNCHFEYVSTHISLFSQLFRVYCYVKHVSTHVFFVIVFKFKLLFLF